MPSLASLVDSGPLVLIKIFFIIYVKALLLFCYYLTLAKGVVLYLNKLEFESLSSMDALCKI